ncbi:MAG: hypothetical protein J6I42_13555 [Clostridia bacterium]|nr:hypothetical protein [Clostridia bacterium]
MFVCPFVFFDGDLDLPQYLSADFADRRTECVDNSRGIEIKNAVKIIVGEIVVRFHPAPAHEGVGDTDGSGIAEPGTDGITIILLQKRICNDVGNFTMVVNPVFLGKMVGNILKLILQVRVLSNVEILCQHLCYSVRVFGVHLPQVDSTGMFTLAGVRYIKDISDFRGVRSCIYERDPS